MRFEFAPYVARTMSMPKTRLVPVFLIALLAVTRSTPAQTTNTLTVGPLTRGPDGWTLSWQPSQPETVYTVQFQDTLQDGLWRIPASAIPYPTPTNSWTDPSSTNLTRFYRVVAVSPHPSAE